MTFQCSSSFAISLVGVTQCTIALDDPDTITVPTSRDSVTFTKHFTYTLGPDPDGDSDNYGFDLEVSGTGAFVVTTEYTFVPITPNIDTSVPEPKRGRVDITMTIDKTAAANLGITGTAETTVTIKMNTGT